MPTYAPISPTQYRLSARVARHLRSEKRALPHSQLAQQVLASQVPTAGSAVAHKILEGLLDGRFECGPETVGLWEWKYAFPTAAEAVVVLDIETTGLSSDQHEIIELAMIRLEGGQRHVFTQLIDPGSPIPSFITRLTGITDQDVSGAPDVYAVLEQALPFLDNATLIIQNAPFDLGFLRPRLARLGHKLNNPVVDTINWARRALPGLPKRGLDSLVQAFDLDTHSSKIPDVLSRHRALGDVEITLQVALKTP
jgi:DNA polymerase III subunit epsilon